MKSWPSPPTLISHTRPGTATATAVRTSGIILTTVSDSAVPAPERAREDVDVGLDGILAEHDQHRGEHRERDGGETGGAPEAGEPAAARAGRGQAPTPAPRSSRSRVPVIR